MSGNFLGRPVDGFAVGQRRASELPHFKGLAGAAGHGMLLFRWGEEPQAYRTPNLGRGTGANPT